MADFSDYLEDAIIDFFLRGNPGAAITAPATVYVALFTADPTDTGDLTNEVVPGGNTYARQAVTFAAPGGDGITENTADVSWVDMPGVTITHFAIMDALTVGNALYTAALGASAALTAGDTYTIAAGNLTITND